MGGNQHFFYWEKFAQKGKKKNSKNILSKFCRKGKINFKKFKNEGVFEGSQLLEVREKIDKIHQIYIFGLQCVTKIYRKTGDIKCLGKYTRKLLRVPWSSILGGKFHLMIFLTSVFSPNFNLRYMISTYPTTLGSIDINYIIFKNVEIFGIFFSK